MSDEPLVGAVYARNVVVVHELHDGIHGENITVLQLPSGARLERIFASVPAPGPQLAGRDTLMADLRARLADGGPVVLHGIPGSGKSALALALAYDVDVLNHFSGGLLWAGLGPHANIDGVLSLWSTTLAVDITSESSSVDRARRLNARLEQQLGGKPFLVVLDDVWRAEDIAPFRVFAARGSALLVTTRRADLAWDLDGAQLVSVPELDAAAAFQILTARRRELAELEPEALRQLADMVGGLPLALVLLEGGLARSADQARWLRTTVQNLQSDTARLALRDTRPRPGRDEDAASLQRIVELSLDAISDSATRNAYADLGTFAAKPYDFARAAALCVWQVTEDVGDGRLQELHRGGLLEVTGEDRFTIHQVLADVARARLAPGSDAAERHYAYYRDAARGASSEWQSFQLELAQVRQARAWASSTPGHEQQVLDLLGPMSLFLRRRGLRAEDLQWHECALKAARALGRRTDEAALLAQIGDIHSRAGELDAALSLFEQALAIAREGNDRASEGAILHLISLVQFRRGQTDDAESCLNDALAAREEVDDKVGLGDTLNALGELEARRGNAEPAQDFFRRAAEVRQVSGDQIGGADTLNSLGGLYHDRGDLANATHSYELALGIYRGVGDRAAEARELVLIGEVHRAAGEFSAALERYEETLKLARELNYLEIEAIALNNIGAVRYQQDDTADALRNWEASLPLRRQVKDRAGEVSTLNNLAAGYRQQGDLEAARRCATDALALAQQIGDHNGESIASRTLSVMDLDAWARSVTPPRKSLVDRLQFWKR